MNCVVIPSGNGIGAAFNDWFIKDDAELPEILTYDEYCDWGRRLRARSNKLQWAVYRWLAGGERNYGESYIQAIEETGYASGYLRNIQSIGNATHAARAALIEQYPEARDIPWGYYEAVAPRDIPDATKLSLLQVALIERMDRDTFQSAVKEIRAKALTPTAQAIPGKSDQPPTAAEYGNALATRLPERAIVLDAPAPYDATDIFDSPAQGDTDESGSTPSTASTQSTPTLSLPQSYRAKADTLIAHYSLSNHTTNDETLYKLLIDFMYSALFSNEETETGEPHDD